MYSPNKPQQGTCASAVDCGMPCCVHVGLCYRSLEAQYEQRGLYLQDLEVQVHDLREALERAYDFGHKRGMWSHAMVVIRKALNPPTPKPSDAQASESDDAVTREGG